MFCTNCGHKLHSADTKSGSKTAAKAVAKKIVECIFKKLGEDLEKDIDKGQWDPLAFTQLTQREISELVNFAVDSLKELISSETSAIMEDKEGKV